MFVKMLEALLPESEIHPPAMENSNTSG